MFIGLVQKEVLLHLREARFVWVTGLFCGLVLLGLTLMGKDYGQRLQGYQTSVMAERRQLLAVDSNLPVRQQVRGLTNDRGVYAFRPPRTLGAMASGLEPAVPTQIHVSDTRFWSRQANERYYQNPLLSLFPRPDFSYIITAILSLVGLFFTFDAICGEKQGGTLKLMVAAGTGRDQILLGKWAGAMLTLGVSFLLATGVGLTLLLLTGRLPLNSTDLLRIGGIVGAGLIYLSLFVILGLLVSAAVSRSSSSLLICLTVWVGTIFLLPHGMASLGRAVAPTSTFQQIRLQKRAIDLDLAGKQARLSERAELSEVERERRAETLRQESEAEKGRIDAAYVRQLNRQVEISQMLSRVSPAACLTYATAELADTGLDFYFRSYEAYGSYRRAFEMYARGLKREADEGRLKTDWLRPEDVPMLGISPQGLEEAFSAAAMDVMRLVLFQVAAFAVAYLLFLFYDVR